MKSIIVIPARYSSSRFPGKPLAPIRGKTMLERTWRIATEAGADDLIIATDDQRIEDLACGFGAKVVRTSHDCMNGTERVYEALCQLNYKPEIILNLQGDAVLTPPWVLQSLIEVMKADPTVMLATPATKLSLAHYLEMREQKASGLVGGTLVVFDKNCDALYFSKSPIPFLRPTTSDDIPVFRHIGLYSYRYQILEQYLQLPPGNLERVEGLEQLRALENGIKIRVLVIDYRGRTHWSVDSPEDIAKVEQIIENEGELVPKIASA